MPSHASQHAACPHRQRSITACLAALSLIGAASADDVRDAIRGMLADTAAAAAVTLCAWSFDRETPIENVTAIYDQVG